jgi:hypothetical protein
MNATSWQGPPREILGHPVPIQQFAAKTDHTVIGLQHVIAFPEASLRARSASQPNTRIMNR